MDDWLNLLIQLVVAVGTLILAYMAYRQIKENRLIENVKIHSNDLKEFLRQWKEKYLLEISPAESVYKCFNPPVVFDEPPTFDEPTEFSFTSFTKRENRLYEDIRNHLPSEYNVLDEKWSNYKELIRGYDEKRKNLLENIEDDLSRTKKTTFPALSIYARAVSLGLKGTLSRASIYNYSVEDECSSYPWERRLKYGIRNKWFCELGKVPLPMMPDKSGSWGSENEENEIAKLKAEYETVADNYNVKYKEEIKEILTIESNLKEMREEISTMLEDFILIPTFPKECKYIKNAFK